MEGRWEGKEGSEGEVSGVCRGRHWQRITLSRDPLGRELARCSRPSERSIAVESILGNRNLGELL